MSVLSRNRAQEPGEDERAVDPADETAADGTPEPAKEKRPLYPRLLHLQHVHPNGWQRALLGEGALAVAALLVLADLATAWTLLVLPLAVAVVVKAHDLLAGAIGQGRAAPPGVEPPDPPPAP